MIRFFTFLLAAIVAVAPFGVAHAQEPIDAPTIQVDGQTWVGKFERRAVPMPVPATGPASVQARIDYIQEIFDREQKPWKMWVYGWIAGFGTLVAGQGMWALLTDDPDTRTERGVGASAATVGFVTSFLGLGKPVKKAELLRDTEATTPEELQAKLEYAESLLRDTADKQKFGRGPLTHLASLAIASTTTMLLWQKYDLPEKAGPNFPTAISVGQLKVWTQPVLSLRGRQAYEYVYGTEGLAWVPSRKRVTWALAPSPRGVGAVVRF